MRFLFLLLCFFTVCCQQSWPEPAAESSQLLVHIKAKARSGTSQKNQQLEVYDNNSQMGWKFNRVNYHKLPDIAVILEGENLAGGDSLPLETTVIAGRHTLDRKLILLPILGKLHLINEHKKPLTFLYFSKADDYEITLKPGESSIIQFNEEGMHELICDENELFSSHIHVIEHRWASMMDSGDTVFFNGVPPGNYQVTVQAPRFPKKELSIQLERGQRQEVSVTLGVQELLKE